MNLVIDPCQHCPSLYYSVSMLGDCQYFTDPSRIGKKPFLYGYYTKEQLDSTFNIKSMDLSYNKFEKEYDNLILVMPISDIGWQKLDNIPDVQSYCLKYYKNILDKLTIKGRIIVIDNSDLSLPNLEFESRIFGENKYPVLKKSMSTLFKYSGNWSPFPYVYVGKYDSMYYLNSEPLPQEYKTKKRSNKVFWAGSFHSALKPDTGEFYDRGQWLTKLDRYIHIDPSNLYDGKTSVLGGYETRCATHKYAIYLRGWNDITRRLVEIMRCESLLLLERSTTTLGIGGNFNDTFNKHCYFSSISEFENNYKTLESYPDLYNECLEHQNIIRDKYFSYKGISNQLRTFIDTDTL